MANSSSQHELHSLNVQFKHLSMRSPSISPIPENSVPDVCPPLRLPFSCGDENHFDNNYDIKSALTDLLNSEGVRNDGRMRLWVQSRLMDAELALKRQRRQKRVHGHSQEFA